MACLVRGISFSYLTSLPLEAVAAPRADRKTVSHFISFSLLKEIRVSPLLYFTALVANLMGAWWKKFTYPQSHLA